MRYFLEQCLYSVYRSKDVSDFDVYVVDNASTDDSLKMLAQKFPQVKLIANTDNKGFSKANNQAIHQSQSEYVLLLNPDTLIQEDTLYKSLQYLDADKQIGGLGVKMLDGSGNFLPESKRGFPSPFAAFSKMTGLSSLFPKSTLFGQYHLSYLDNNKNHNIDVLSGACMFLRKSVLDKIGLLDEDYFMYGEDIDLSYRIRKAGFKNVYFADTSIIHFKGESTKKGSLNYIRVFYQAMIIFANKHVTGAKGKMLTGLLRVAIYIRALMAILQSALSGLFYPLLDGLLMLLGILVSTQIFEKIIKHNEGVHYPTTFFWINTPIYILLWLSMLWLFGAYQAQHKWKQLIAGIFSGTLLIALVYSFFPLYLRSSRGIIISAFLWNIVVLSAIRFVWQVLKGSLRVYIFNEKKYIILATGKEAIRIEEQLSKSKTKRQYLGFVSLQNDINVTHYIGNIDSIVEICELYHPNELLFSTDTIPMQQIIETMSKIKDGVDFKLVSKNSAIIGSSSKNSAGDVYTFEVDINPRKSFIQRLRDWL